MIKFKCPRCGGKAFGLHFPVGLPTIIHCQCDKHGQPVSGEPGTVTRRDDYCGWHGDQREAFLLEDSERSNWIEYQGDYEVSGHAKPDTMVSSREYESLQSECERLRDCRHDIEVNGGIPVAVQRTAALEENNRALQAEIERLRRGEFTPEELQNICHNLSEHDKNAFFNGCSAYQCQLFGESREGVLMAELERLRNLGILLATAVDAWESCKSSHVISDQVRMPRLTKAWYDEANEALYGR